MLRGDHVNQAVRAISPPQTPQAKHTKTPSIAAEAF